MFAASFSTPKLEKEEAVQGDEKVFLCHSTGGYPTPAVYWLINDSEEPPRRVGEDSDDITPRQSLQHHQPLDPQHFPRLHCVVHH